jgi:signal transduction histidine kinase
MNESPDITDHQARVLIVDDIWDNIEVLETMLVHEGFLLLTAASGEEALAMVAQQPPDLILLDVMMPGMDGYQVARAIKGNLATKNIPIIMVTALHDHHAKMLGLSAGAEDFLSKPIDRAELCVRVRNLLRLKAYGEYYDRYSHVLESQVASRTADLVERTTALEQQAAVVAGQAALLEINRNDEMRFKDEFLSHVSHELRSPLTAIKQFTTILLGGLAGELNKEQREFLQIILKNIRQLQSMIDDLLEVTRLETGKLTVEPESVSVSDTVADALESLQVTAGARGVTVSCDVPRGLPSVHADRTRFRQILINLVENAIKFSSDGGAVRIQARLLQQDPRFLLLEVSDTGCGISPEIAEAIFQRLYQVSERTQGSRKGLGLGLYICRELVTRQGGQIWAAPQPEQGSLFSFTLPVFSLNDLMAPLLKNDKWPADSVALVMVETRRQDGRPSRESQEEWSREAHTLVQRCLLPDLDVLLPKISSGAEGERFFVAAFADDKGASVLAKRIREQFERLPHLKQAGLTLSVSYRMLAPAPPDPGASTENIVIRMATHLEASIRSNNHLGGYLS